MHVLWLNENAHALGGAERYVHDTARLLAARGHRSTLAYDVASRVDADWLRPFEGAYPLVDLTRQVRELRPDVIYAHRISEGRVVEELAALAARTPVLRFFHDHKLFCLREHKYTAIGRRTCTATVGAGCYACLGFAQRAEAFPGVRLVSVSALRRDQRRSAGLSGFVVGSRYMADHVAAHGFPQEKIHRIPLAVAPTPTREPGAVERDLVLFVGQLVRGKGLDVLLRATARGRHRLVVVGDGRQREELVALARGLGVEARVTFTGALPRGAIDDWLARARCLAMPSRAPETFGLAGLEATARGVPVVGSDVGGMGEWLAHEVNGLRVPAGDVDALALALGRIVEDDALARRLGHGAVARHRAAFLPERHVDQLEALLGRLHAARAA